jgi:O-antigen/teichoic acid export membrane protein
LKISQLLNFPAELKNLSFIKGSDSRTIKAKKNIAASFIVKGISILIMFALVPLLIKQLNTEKYGIWLTFATIITWFSFFDIGLGNGLKNILANKLAEDDLPGAKKAISTAYISISVLSLFLISIFLLGNKFINWAKVLNAPDSMQSELNTLAYFVIISFCLQLIFRLISSIFDAIQMPAVSGAIAALGNLLSLILILLILFISNSHSLLLYGIALTTSPIAALLIGTVYFFRKKHPGLIPSYKSFDRSMVKSLFGLGGRFFLIQITSIVLYQTNSFVIAHVVGVSSVTTYDIAYKYAGIFQMVFTIILSPIWIASTEAYAHNNIDWIYKAISKLNKVLLLIIIASVIQLLVSKQLYRLWIGDKVRIDYLLTFLMQTYFILSMRGGLYCMILNGIGKIKLQFIFNFAEALIHLPLSIILGRHFGIIGVVMSMCLVVSLNAIWMPKQCKAILAGTAKGIWNE